MIKQITDLEQATTIELNKDCQFVMDTSSKKTKKISFYDIENKISSDIPLATLSSNGLMTSSDKRIINSLSSTTWIFDFTDDTPRVNTNIVLSVNN